MTDERDLQAGNAALRVEVEELRRHATTDGLTRLLNHRAF
jgi:GGDEF domain-containing protein